MAVSLFVGNLPYNATEAELRALFSTVGQLSNVYLPTDRETGKLRGFAFIEFSERAHAEEAIRRFNNELFKGRPLTVNEARAREERPRTSMPPRTPSYNTQAGRSEASEPQGVSNKPTRNFSPDAAPKRRGKNEQKSERNPKRPIREVERAQFFGGDDDDSYDGEFEEDNFASREVQSEDSE
jgi:RNA recognition motif-containing protein